MDTPVLGPPAKIYIHQLNTDTWCCLEDLPSAMDDGRESKESVLMMMMIND